MTSAHPHRLEPDLSRRTARGASVFNSAGLASTVPSASVSSRGVSSAAVSIAVLLQLGSFGLVGAVTAGFFFGGGFLLLSQPSEQIHAGSPAHDRNTEVSRLRPGGSSATAENGTLGRDFQVLSSTPSAMLIAPAQTAALDEAGQSWKATSTSLPLDGEVIKFRRISRASNSRSDPMLGKARMIAGRVQSTKPDGKQDPEESATDSANLQEYNQLHAVGPAVNLTAEAVEAVTPR